MNKFQFNTKVLRYRLEVDIEGLDLALVLAALECSCLEGFNISSRNRVRMPWVFGHRYGRLLTIRRQEAPYCSESLLRVPLRLLAQKIDLTAAVRRCPTPRFRPSAGPPSPGPRAPVPGLRWSSKPGSPGSWPGTQISMLHEHTTGNYVPDCLAA